MTWGPYKGVCDIQDMLDAGCCLAKNQGMAEAGSWALFKGREETGMTPYEKAGHTLRCCLVTYVGWAL